MDITAAVLNKITKSIHHPLIILLVTLALLDSCIFSSFVPPKLTVTRNCIVTNRRFVNGVTIEKILVDSIGENGYPVKYTTIYTTSCNLHQATNKATVAPDKIEFYKPGKYSWDEDTINVRYVHIGLSRQPLDSAKEQWWLNKFGSHPICPVKFEPEQWYFLTTGDPQVTGIFFYIDKNNKEHQYYLESGVSPI